MNDAPENTSPFSEANYRRSLQLNEEAARLAALETEREAEHRARIEKLAALEAEREIEHRARTEKLAAAEAALQGAKEEFARRKSHEESTLALRRGEVRNLEEAARQAKADYEARLADLPTPEPIKPKPSFSDRAKDVLLGITQYGLTGVASYLFYPAVPFYAAYAAYQDEKSIKEKRLRHIAAAAVINWAQLTGLAALQPAVVGAIKTYAVSQMSVGDVATSSTGYMWQDVQQSLFDPRFRKLIEWMPGGRYVQKICDPYIDATNEILGYAGAAEVAVMVSPKAAYTMLSKPPHPQR